MIAGYTTTAGKTPQCKGGQTSGCTSRVLPDTKETGYTSEWYARMIHDPANAKHYEVPGSSELSEADKRKILRMDKKR